MKERDILNLCLSSPLLWGWTGSIGRGNTYPHFCGGVLLYITLTYQFYIATIIRVFFEPTPKKVTATNYSLSAPYHNKVALAGKKIQNLGRAP